jgi:hypothetical protein
MIDWVLRREDPDTRAFILKAIEGNRTGVDIPALREGLRLSSRQMDVLRKGFGDSRLRRLSAEQPPCSSSPQAVVEALQQEVQRIHLHLSMRDVLTLAKFGAREIERRSSGEEIPAKYQAGQLYKSLAMSDCFKGRELDDDPLLKREMGPIEIQIGDQLAKANDALAPLLNVAARWLDTLLSRAASGAPPLSPQQQKDLAKRIGFCYPILLAHSFSLGEDGPQHMHHLLQHHVRKALDRLKTEDRPVDTLGKRKAQQLDGPSAAWLAIEQSRQQARADGWHVAATARAMLTGEFELQQGLRCLQHAFNNGCANWLALHRPGTPFVRLSLPNEAQELGRIDPVVGPDGFPMQRLRLMPRQLQALMPELEAHLDLAIVFKGPTNLQIGDSQVNQTHHYTALIKVNGVHFELESIAADHQAGKRWLPSLRDYLERLQGGVYMAIRGSDDHPLSKYVKLMAIEPFWKTCEALGVLLGTQPIIGLARFLPVDEMQDAARQLDANVAAAFCRSRLSLPDARSHETKVPEGPGRSEAVVNWLNTLGANEVILWTGTEPMVTAAVRASSGEWLAPDRVRRSLLEVLEGQQSLFEGLAPDEHKKRAGFARALTLAPPVVHAIPPALAQSAVQGGLPVAVVQVQNLRSPGEQTVAESQHVLLRAFTDYQFYQERNKAIRDLARDPAITTGAEVIDRLLNGGLERRQFEMLLTMSRNWLISKPPDPAASQHLAVLFVVNGRVPTSDDLLQLLPSEIPPCLAPYARRIQQNVSSWRSWDRVVEATLAKLGLRPTIDLT